MRIMARPREKKNKRTEQLNALLIVQSLLYECVSEYVFVVLLRCVFFLLKFYSSVFYFCGFVIIDNLNENTHLHPLARSRSVFRSRIIQDDHKSLGVEL